MIALLCLFALLPVSGVGCVLTQLLGGLGGLGAGGGIGGLAGAAGPGGPIAGGLGGGPLAPGIAAGAAAAPGTTGGTPAGPDPLRGGGSAAPPLVAGPGASDLTPPGNLGADDYDPRPDLSTVDVNQYTFNPPREEARVPYVQDVLSHDARPDMQTTNMGTWVHETSHGIHATIRNWAVTSGGNAKVQGAYFEAGKGAYCFDPMVSKSRVSAFLPAAARGVSRYDLYVAGQNSDWPNALHLFDEWGAYINGSRACVEVFAAGQWREGTVDSVDGVSDFLYFCTAAMRVVEADAPTYLDPANRQGKSLKAFFAMQVERSARWLGAGLQVANFRAFHAGQLFQHFQSSPDNGDNRKFLARWMGKGWTKRVLGFTE